MGDYEMTEKKVKQCPRCLEYRLLQNFYVGREICRSCIADSNRLRRQARISEKGTVSELMARWGR